MEQAPKGNRRLVLVHANPEISKGGRGDRKDASPTREQFEYLADMIRQMQVLAWQTGCSKLAGLLEQAHREADQQRRNLGKRLSWFEPA